MTTLATQPMIRHPRLGLIEVPQECILELVAPLPPFASLRHFSLLPDPEEEYFLWLQSLEQPALALVLMPYALVATEAPPVPRGVREELGLGPDEAPEWYVIVSLGEEARQVTVNLLAPLVVSPRTHRARQVVQEGDLALARRPLL